ncbi:MAG TPA: iron chelate uptake ABC transporter family permease subunit, partial [Candidatus Ozemobacteraceae bacterium]|nr:iron chelate uptake ABC transporter family permease subunit [Candidatus Ozemobacteraceae bacterium]
MNHTATFTELVQFFHDAILVAVLTGAILGPVGLFLHLRRSLFLGAALPQVAGFAFVVATVVGIPTWLSAMCTILIFSLFAAWKPVQATDGLTLETLIALAYTVSMAGIILLLALTQAEAHAAELLLKGSVLAATCQDTRLLAWAGIPLVIVLYLFRRVLYLVSLDPETARTLGISVWKYETLLFLALGLAITLTLGEA